MREAGTVAVIMVSLLICGLLLDNLELRTQLANSARMIASSNQLACAK